MQYVKAPVVDFKQRKKMKGKGGSVNAFKAKRIVRDSAKRVRNLFQIWLLQMAASYLNIIHFIFVQLQKFVDEIKGVKKQIIREHRVKKEGGEVKSERTVLDRFKSKKRN